MMCNYYRFGGVARDLPEGTIEKTKGLVFDRLERKIDELDAYITNNEIVRNRAQGVGVLTPEDAIAFSTVGPVLRASGVPLDLRRADPYSIYDRFEFDVGPERVSFTPGSSTGKEVHPTEPCHGKERSPDHRSPSASPFSTKSHTAPRLVFSPSLDQ